MWHRQKWFAAISKLYDGKIFNLWKSIRVFPLLGKLSLNILLKKSIFVLFCLIVRLLVWLIFSTFSTFSHVNISAIFLFKTFFRGRGGRTYFPQFKFSAKCPIGLPVILKLQIKKNLNLIESDAKNILTENPLRCSLSPLLKKF